jgi:putative transposase
MCPTRWHDGATEWRRNDTAHPSEISSMRWHRQGDRTTRRRRRKRVEVNALHHQSVVMQEYPLRLRHETPGWVKSGSVFHVRVRAALPQTPLLTDPCLARALIAAAKRYHELDHWWCELFLVMPNHVHAMLAFRLDADMSVVVSNWKRGVARFQHVLWQSNYFDHRIRSAKESQATWWYIRRNPVAKNLCVAENDWPYWWSALTPTRSSDSSERKTR